MHPDLSFPSLDSSQFPPSLSSRFTPPYPPAPCLPPEKSSPLRDINRTRYGKTRHKPSHLSCAGQAP